MRMSKIIAVVLSLWVLVSAAVAIPVTTSQTWSFDTDQQLDILPDDGGAGNDFGDPLATISGPPFMSDLTWEDGIWSATALTVTFDIPNNPVANQYKEINVTIKFAGQKSLSWAKNADGEDFEFIDFEEDTYEGWNYRSDIWRIEPNPTAETLCYGFQGIDGPAMIDSVTIETACIPEPATVSVLGLGLCVLVKTKSRKNK